jgi:3-oxoacyl-[acyl-carrier-protein] synthase II
VPTHKRVGVTGMGVISPYGAGADKFSEGIFAGRVTIEPDPWAKPGEPSGWVSIVRDFDPTEWADQRVVNGSDIATHFVLAAAGEALRSAGLESPDPLRTGVVLSSSSAGTQSLMQAQNDLATKGPEAVSGKMMLKVWPNMSAGHVALRYGLHGPQLTVCTACAGGADALGTARDLLLNGRADAIIVGGTETSFTFPGGTPDFVPVLFEGIRRFGMQQNGADPEQASMPFDRNRTGMVTGDASAVVILETEESIAKRGVTPLGWILGYGSLADSFHPSAPNPSGEWEAMAMRNALAEAEVEPAEIDAVLAHATGTPKGDTAEIRAINDVFPAGERDAPLLVSSLKGAIGHTGAASAILNLIAAIKGRPDRLFPCTASTRDADPEIEFDLVLGQAREADVRRLQINAFGFGGQNASIVAEVA